MEDPWITNDGKDPVLPELVEIYDDRDKGFGNLKRLEMMRVIGSAGTSNNLIKSFANKNAIQEKD